MLCELGSVEEQVAWRVVCDMERRVWRVWRVWCVRGVCPVCRVGVS